METKPRILYLKKILEERTDEEHPFSTTQLINILNDEYGISAHRTTVTKDIAALQEFGMDIVTIHYVHFLFRMCGCIKLQYRFGLNDAYHAQIESRLIFNRGHDDVEAFSLHVLANAGE